LKIKQSLNPNSLKGTYNTPNKRLGKREGKNERGERRGKGRKKACSSQPSKQTKAMEN
jgi:hypothetical protein